MQRLVHFHAMFLGVRITAPLGPALTVEQRFQGKMRNCLNLFQSQEGQRPVLSAPVCGSMQLWGVIFWSDRVGVIWHLCWSSACHFSDEVPNRALQKFVGALLLIMIEMCVWTICGSVDLKTLEYKLTVAKVAAGSDYLWICCLHCTSFLFGLMKNYYVLLC